MIKQVVSAILPENAAFKIKQVLYSRNRKDEELLVKKNRMFKDVHHGKRCFILGNGPSMKELDLSVLKNEFTFSVNQLPRRDDYKYLNTTYHMWADWRFFQVDLDKGIDLELYEVMKNVYSGNNHPKVFYSTRALSMIKKLKLDEILDIEYFMDIGVNMPYNIKCLDFDSVLPMFSTVVQYAIALAVYMGFGKIYLLGCDTTGILNEIEARIQKGTVSYAYEVTKEEKERMTKIAFQNSIQMELRGTARILDDYEKLLYYCRRNDVDLVNLTDSTLIECIPRKRLTDIL